MKQKILTMAAAVCTAMLFSTSVNAQGSVGTDFGIVKWVAKDVETKAMPGFNLSFKHKVAEHVKLGINAGIYQRSLNEDGVKGRQFFVPVTALFEYHFLNAAFSPYAGTDLGVYRFGYKANGEKADAKSYFGFAPVVGIDYAINEKISFNANSKMHLLKIKEWDTKKPTSFFALNIGMNFKF